MFVECAATGGYCFYHLVWWGLFPDNWLVVSWLGQARKQLDAAGVACCSCQSPAQLHAV